MRRYIPGLHASTSESDDRLEGIFLVRVERAFYRWHPQKPFLALRFGVLEPREHVGRSISGRLYCTERALWKLNWFLRDFGYDPELFGRDQVDDKACLNLRGIVRTSYTSHSGHSFQNLEAFAPASEWDEILCGAASGQQVSEKF